MENKRRVIDWLLERKVATHPGYYYDFAERSPHLVLSLLPEPAVFARGAEAIRREVERRASGR